MILNLASWGTVPSPVSDNVLSVSVY